MKNTKKILFLSSNLLLFLSLSPLESIVGLKSASIDDLSVDGIERLLGIGLRGESGESESHIDESSRRGLVLLGWHGELEERSGSSGEQLLELVLLGGLVEAAQVQPLKILLALLRLLSLLFLRLLHVGRLIANVVDDDCLAANFGLLQLSEVLLGHFFASELDECESLSVIRSLIWARYNL